MFFSLREIKSSLKRFFSPDFTCKAIFITNLMFYKVVNAILLFGGKENANERKESLLSICRVQLFFCKDTTFPRNFQGFREKILEKGEEKKKIGGSRIGGEPPIENNYFLRCFKKSSIPTISTFGKGMFSNSLKCLSSVTIKIALLAMAQSTNLLSSSSAFINPKL